MRTNKIKRRFTVHPTKTGMVCGQFGWNNVFRAKITLKRNNNVVEVRLLDNGIAIFSYSNIKEMFKEWSILNRRILIEKAGFYI